MLQWVLVSPVPSQLARDPPSPLSSLQVPSQVISACPSNASAPGYVNRTKYGMAEGQARNAPEFDVFEIM